MNAGVSHLKAFLASARVRRHVAYLIQMRADDCHGLAFRIGPSVNWKTNIDGRTVRPSRLRQLRMQRAWWSPGVRRPRQTRLAGSSPAKTADGAASIRAHRRVAARS